MKALGTGLIVLGVIGIMLAVVNHNHPLIQASHGSLIIGVAGVILLVAGGILDFLGVGH